MCVILLLFLLNLLFWLIVFGYIVNKESLFFGVCIMCLLNLLLLERFDWNIYDDMVIVFIFGWIIWSFYLILFCIYGFFIIYGYFFDKFSLVK